MNDFQGNITHTLPSSFLDSMRVTEDDGVTLVPIWNETATVVWCRFPFANQSYYLYWGNSDASAVWNSSAVFERVISSGLQLALPMNEGSGNCTDYSGNGNMGSVTGADWIATGPFGNALDFVAANTDKVVINDADSLEINLVTTDYSFMLYVATSDINSRNIIGKTAGFVLYDFKLNGGGWVTADALDGVDTMTTHSNIVVNDGVWRNFILTFNHTTKTISIYVNGVDVTNAVATEDVGDVSNNADLIFATDTVTYWDGSLNGVFKFNRLLSADEIIDFGVNGYYPQCSSANLGSLYLREWWTGTITTLGTTEYNQTDNALAIGALALIFGIAAMGLVMLRKK